MPKSPVADAKGWRKLVGRVLSWAQYLTGQESTVADKNDAVFRGSRPNVGFQIG